MATYDPQNWITVSSSNTAATDNWYINSSSTTGGYSIGSYITGATGLYLRKTTNDIERIGKQALKWAKEFIKESPNYPNLVGFSGLATRHLHKLLKNEGIKSKIAYLNTQSYQHIFLIISSEEQWGVSLDEQYLLDITAVVYGEDEICLLPYKDINLAEKPWWSYDDLYESDSGLMARQRRDKWPITQISLTEAKKKQNSIGLVQVGRTNVEAGIIKINPFDEDAIKFFKSQAKGNGLKANLASLIMDENTNIADAALRIATELLSR